MVSKENMINDAWGNLSMAEKAEMMKVAVRNGITDLKTIREKYNEFAKGGDTDPGMTGMMKSKLATAAHFGNPTARRITNYDARSYTWPGEYEYDNGIGELKRGNVFVGSYDNLVTPQIQDDGKGLIFVDDVWSPENDQRSYLQSLKFDNENDARYFGEHYKEIAPMMNLYSMGGHKIHIKPENRGKFTALKERTGHSATWFKEHGTPAQRKMATFELNAKHWKHGLGGNLFAGAPTDDDLIDWIIREEGFASKPEDIGDGKLTLGSGLTAKKWHDLYKKRGNKWSAADNRMAVAEEVADRRKWAEKNIPNWSNLPDSSQKALLSYKYNYDFNKANSPKLFQALADSNLYEAARQMDATSKNPKFKKGLMDRRKREQEWFLKGVETPPVSINSLPDNSKEVPVSTAVVNPYIINAPAPEYLRPVMVPDENSYVKAHVQTPSEKRVNSLLNFLQSIEDYDRTKSEYNVQNTPIYQFNAPYVVRSLGGNLFDGTSQPSQQMQIGRGYWESQANQPTLEEELAEYRKQRALKVQKAIETLKSKEFKDNVEKTINKKTRANSTTSNDAIFNTTVSKNSHLGVRGEEGAKAHAAWEKEHPNLTAWGNVAGTIPFAVAAVPLGAGAIALGDALATTTAGQALTASLSPLYQAATGATIAGAPALAWADAGLTSAFGAHGISQAVEDGGISPMTALEVAPLGRLVKPMWNAAKLTRNFIPTLESNMSGVRYAYNRNSELANIGTLENYNDYLKTIFPESKVRDINYHMGPKGLQELKPSTGDVWNTNPDARGIYVTPDKSYAQRIRKYTTDRLEKPSIWTYIKRNLTPGGWNRANEAFTDIYPVMIDTRNPLYTKGTWTWGIKDKKYQSLFSQYDGIINAGPKWYQNVNSMPETIVPKTEQSLILGSDADVAGFRRFMSNPQITAENASGITPEQWTAAQDAAIARGDMAEAQRLRDLHFKVSAPDTKITDEVYHGSRRGKDFNSFDLRYFGYTDGGTGGYGHYFGPLNHASAYTNPRRFYVNVQNPYIGKHIQFFNRDSYFRDNELFGRIPNREDAIRYKEGLEKYADEFTGKDGAIDNDPIWGELGPVYTIPRGEQIKLADAVTYDDNGVRIPLGLRDNFKINDIRYGLLPFLGLGAAGTLYRKQD